MKLILYGYVTFFCTLADITNNPNNALVLIWSTVNRHNIESKTSKLSGKSNLFEYRIWQKLD